MISRKRSVVAKNALVQKNKLSRMSRGTTRSIGKLKDG